MRRFPILVCLTAIGLGAAAPAAPAPGGGAAAAARVRVLRREARANAVRIAVLEAELRASLPARSRRSALASARLERGWCQAEVFARLGPPEYVRGRRGGIQFWHYGSGWVCFQSGRLAGWDRGNAGRLSRAAGN